MAGLGRIQQRFNAAIVGTLAALIGFARGGDRQATKRLLEHGHPILAKYLKSSNPRANQSGHDYPGYAESSVPKQHRPGILALGQSTTPMSGALYLHRQRETENLLFREAA